ncbi:hypothetical protein PSTT_01979 [Puccinia striiformis]|uniref:Uncharacterized protein n=1 Tax=Puccinia striiformis TaxID=27350 RepID=A0A2S4W1X5_9BASI|nr:hypothetical protein PSTT_01979 [Puccinia striiformis]
MVPITLECLLFLEHGPLAGSLGIASGWTKVSSPSVLSPWDADLDNMDWTAFQGGAMQFLAMHATHLLPNMEDANLSKKIDWFASITNRPKGAPDLTFLVKGNVGFLHFREAALAADPGHLKVRMSMIDPRDLTPLLVQASQDMRTPVVYGLLAQSFKRKITTDPNLEHQTNHPDEPVPKHHCKGAAIDLDEIEIIELEPAIQSPGPSNGPPEKKKFRSPMPPSRIAMERIPMEEYLNVAHIPADDVATRDLLLECGITHWSHFRSSDEDDLMALGFRAGPARLLWEGVPRLDEYVDAMERGFRPASTPPPASGPGLAHQVIYD